MTQTRPSVADHPAHYEMRSMWHDGYRATKINEMLVQQGYPPLDRKTLGRYGQRYWSSPDSENSIDEVELRQVAPDEDIVAAKEYVSELERAGLKVRDFTISKRHSPGWQRNSPDEAATSVTNISSSRTFKVVPFQEPVALDRAPSYDVKLSFSRSAVKAVKPSGWGLGVFLPDMQIGFNRAADGRYTTCHDESALDVAHQVLSEAEQLYGVDLVINAGDNLDFPDFGKHRSAPSVMGNVQLALDRASKEVAIQRQLAPEAKIVWLAGNHDTRLTNYLLDKAPAVVGLTRVDDVAPVMSVPYLCRFDEYGVEYLDGYPSNEIWVNDHLRFEHGHLYSSVEGGTAVKHLKNGVSVGYGHIHRSELLYQTRNTAKGPRTHFAGSPGALCKITGSVPSTKSGILASGKQSGRAESWQQGLWVFWYQREGDQLTSLEPIQIWGGWSLWRGTEYRATVDPDGFALSEPNQESLSNMRLAS